MHQHDLIRHVTLRYVLNVFREMHATPPDMNLRAGVLRIGGEPLQEPLIVPRHWLVGDPDRRMLADALTYAWHAITHDPIRCTATHAKAWHLTLCFRDIEDEGDGEWMLFIESDEHIEYPRLLDDVAVDESSKSCFELNVALQQQLAVALTEFRPGPAYLQEEDERFIDDLTAALVREIDRRLSPVTFTEAIEWLSAEGRPAQIELARTRPLTSPLRIKADEIAACFRVAYERDSRHISHGYSQRHLAPFIPLAHLAGHDATPEGVVAWLRANGLSRKALLRLPRLPQAIIENIANEWAYNVRLDYRRPVAWLGRLLAMLYGARELAPDNLRITIAAQIASAAGIAGADITLRNELPEDARETGYDALEENEDYASLAMACIVATLAQQKPTVAAVLADTFIREVLAATPERMEEMREHIGDVVDWLRNNDVTWGARHELLAEDVGPDWRTLMRRQHEWHLRQAELYRRDIGTPRVQPGPPVPPITWSSPCGEFMRDEYIVTPLVSSTELWEEGRALQHCVATYTDHCQLGYSYLFSVRTAEERTRQGTAEFRRQGKHFRLVQFRGRRNAQLMTREGFARPPYEAVMTELLARLNG